MNIPETAALLAMVAASDRRTVGELDIEVWHDALSDLDFDDCRDAVRAHIRTSTDWLLPAHVRGGAKLAKRQRLERVEVFTPDANPDDVPAYIEARRSGRVRTDEQLRAHDMRALTGVFRDVPAVSPAVIASARDAVPVRQLTQRAEDAGMAQARAEIAAREPIPVPDEELAP